MARLLFATVCMLLLTIHGKGQSSDTDFCSSLQQVISAAKDGFREFKGTLDPDSEGEAFTATYAIVGSHDCDVWIYRDPDLTPSYRCALANGQDVESLQSQYDRVVGEIKACLPDYKLRQRSSVGKYTIEDAEFINPRTRITVSLTRAPRRTYMVRLDVSQKSD